jgi:hypothetical protein
VKGDKVGAPDFEGFAWAILKDWPDLIESDPGGIRRYLRILCAAPAQEETP